MELAGHVPGGAIKTERLKEIPAKESRDGSFAEGLQRRVVGSSQSLGMLAGKNIPLLLLVTRGRHTEVG